MPASPRSRPVRILPILYIPAQIAGTLWALFVVSNPRLPALAFASLTLSVGVTTGVFGVLAAHELVHSMRRGDRFLGGVMLTAMCYRQFRIAHVYGHHRWAGTEHDAATARAGEGFYGFLLRTVLGQLVEAWRFEERRRAARTRTVLANRVVHDGFIMAAVFSAIGAAFGWRGLVFFLGQSVTAIVVLELFNYIAHYGLVREVRGDGRREPLSDSHSWNSSNVLANALIFNMGRHSDHHRAPAAPFQHLARVPSAPELPAGYAGSIILALVPPLWRCVMDPEIQRVKAQGTGRAAA
jgi:alkane 1-monooxygenase